MPASRRARHARGARPPWRHAALLLPLLATAAHQPAAIAIEAIELEARTLEAGAVRARDVRLRLELPREAPARARGPLRSSVTAASLDLGPSIGRYGTVRLTCPDTRLDEPEFGCEQATLTGRVEAGAWLPPLAARLRLGWNLQSGTLAARGVWTLQTGMTLHFAARQRDGTWRASASLPGADLAALRAWLGPALGLPAGVAVDGRLDANLDARGGASVEQGSLQIAVRGLDFGDEDGTFVGEDVALQLSVAARPRAGSRGVEVQLDGLAGQALLGPALLDFGAHPLAVRGRGRWRPDALDFDEVTIVQRDLSEARATATLGLRPALSLREAQLELRELRLPEAYTAYAQIALAATDFGALATRGRISGSARIRDGVLTAIDARLLGLEIEDTRGKFTMRDVHGRLHWAPAGQPVEDSVMTWSAGSAYGLAGDSARIEFRAHGASLTLTRPTRLPIFDGALLIRTLNLEGLGSADPVLQFEADIEPISLQRLAPAFGWPELAGKVSGRIPRIDFRDNLLTVAGDVEARVFGGRIVGSGLRLQDPLGPWPRLFADVRAYDLDLAEVTQTFSIGSISGRLEGHLLGLELFNWSPVAFDALLRTPARDRSPHKISARAIGNLSNIGGGGGGVFQTLQSGVLQFFDKYDYDRIGLRCKLANEVCLMSGIEPVGDGYYILKGKGLPRIDIIGNAGRVSWPQLMNQIATQMRGEGKIRIE